MSRCSSRSRRSGPGPRFRLRCASSAATSSSRRPTCRSAAARRLRTSRAISSAGSRSRSSARTPRRRLDEFAAAAPRLRVVNALTNEEHPCQALADCSTLIEEWGSLPRAHDCVRGRRQQRRDVARAGRDDARRARSRRIPAGYRAVGRTSAERRARRAVRRVARDHDRSAETAVRGRGRRLHGRVDVHGPGRRGRRATRRCSRPTR